MLVVEALAAGFGQRRMIQNPWLTGFRVQGQVLGFRGLQGLGFTGFRLPKGSYVVYSWAGVGFFIRSYPEYLKVT